MVTWRYVLAVIIFTVLASLLYANIAHAETLQKVSPHFYYKELCCKCCGECKLNIELIVALEKLRNLVNKPIIVNSGYRCRSHNRAIGGVVHSQHTQGNAVDIVIRGYSPAEVARLGKKCGFIWTKVYANFTHLHVRSK